MFTEDLTPFFDDFAIEVDFKGTKFQGIFENDFDVVDVGNVVVDSSSPKLLCQSVDVALVKTDDSLKINGEFFSVVSIQPDGTGVTNIILQERD